MVRTFACSYFVLTISLSTAILIHYHFSIEESDLLDKIKNFRKQTNDEEKDVSFCMILCSCFSVIFGSFLFIYNEKKIEDEDENEIKDEEEPSKVDSSLVEKSILSMSEFKKKLGPSLALLQKPNDNLQDTNEKRIDLWLTFLNAGIFVINFYVCVINILGSDVSVKTEAEKAANEASCQVEFGLPPKNISYELCLLPACLAIPFYIAVGLKFSWENRSFQVLKSLHDSIDNKSRDITQDNYTGKSRLATFLLNQVKQSNRISFYLAICVLVLYILALSLTKAIICKFTSLTTVSAILFCATGICATTLPFNIIRAYTIFLKGNIAVLQAQIKSEIKNQEQKNTETDADDENSPFDDGLLDSSKKIFKNVKILIEKFEGPTKIRFVLLIIIFASVLLYGFYFSLYFHQDIWPKLEKEISGTDAPTMSPVPSMIPSMQPSMEPSVSPSQKDPIFDQLQECLAFSKLHKCPDNNRLKGSCESDDQEMPFFYKPKDCVRSNTSLGAPNDGSDSPGPSTSTPSIISILKNAKDLASHEKYEVLFATLIVALLIFIIAYTYQTLLLFAEQGDAWDQLDKFMKANKVNVKDNSKESFEKLSNFISSAKQTFAWTFIVKKQHETSKDAAMKALSQSNNVGHFPHPSAFRSLTTRVRSREQ